MAWNNDQSNAYLSANPDVYAAVMQGQFPDAETHFQRHGINELRRGVPMQSPVQSPFSSSGGAFDGSMPQQPAMGGAIPGMANSLNQGFGEANASGAFNTIGDYLGKDPAIAQAFASGELDQSDVINHGPGHFSISPRAERAQVRAMQRQQQQQQMEGIESRLRAVDSRYDNWKTSQNPRDQANIRNLVIQQAGQGWHPSMYGAPATGIWAGTEQYYNGSGNGPTHQQQPNMGAFGGMGPGGQQQGPRYFGTPNGQAPGSGFGGTYPPQSPMPSTGARPPFGGAGQDSPPGWSSGFGGSQMRPGGAFGGSQAGSFQRQPNMQGTFDAFSGGMQKRPVGGFQGGNMGFNQQQPNMGAFGGGQSGFLR